MVFHCIETRALAWGRVGVTPQLKCAKESSKANWGPVVLLEQPAAFAVPALGILDGHFSPEMASAMF